MMFPLFVAPSQPVDPIQADRPSFSNGIGIEPKGRQVLEMGIRQTLSGDSTLHEFGDGMTLRVPFSNQLEFRLGVPSYAISRQTGSRFVGFEDANLGLKLQLKPSNGAKAPGFGLLLDTTVPTGSPDFRTKALQPEARLLVAFNPTDRLEIDANAGYLRPVESGFGYNRLEFSVAATLALRPDTSVFVDAYTLRPGSLKGPNADVFDFGITHLLGTENQVDLYAGLGLDHNPRDGFIGFGFAHRF